MTSDPHANTTPVDHVGGSSVPNCSVKTAVQPAPASPGKQELYHGPLASKEAPSVNVMSPYPLSPSTCLLTIPDRAGTCASPTLEQTPPHQRVFADPWGCYPEETLRHLSCP